MYKNRSATSNHQSTSVYKLSMTTRRGQTMLELVLASGVLLTTVTAAITLIVRTTVVGQTSSGKSEALNYAREGLEVVRMIRDSNWLKIDRNMTEDDGSGTMVSIPWDENSARINGEHDAAVELIGSYPLAINPASQRYILDYSPSGDWPNAGWGLRVVGTGASPLKIVRRMNDEGQYTTQNVAACISPTCVTTRYCREITVTNATETSGPNTVPYLLVTSTVTWPTGNDCANPSAKSVSLSTRLYDWR